MRQRPAEGGRAHTAGPADPSVRSVVAVGLPRPSTSYCLKLVSHQPRQCMHTCRPVQAARGRVGWPVESRRTIRPRLPARGDGTHTHTPPLALQPVRWRAAHLGPCQVRQAMCRRGWGTPAVVPTPAACCSGLTIPPMATPTVGRVAICMVNLLTGACPSDKAAIRAWNIHD